MTNCNKCGKEVRVVPAGLSKTKKDAQGNPKPYGSFYKCEACGYGQNVGEQPKKPQGNAQLDRIEKKLDALMHFQGMNGNVVSN